MADSPITLLPAATTPLAGNLPLPLVQGGVTKKANTADVAATCPFFPGIATPGTYIANSIPVFGDTTGTVMTDSNVTITNGQIMANGLSFTGTTTAGLTIKSLTTTQRDAVPSPVVGMLIWNTTNTRVEVYNGTAWVIIPSNVVGLGTMAFQNANAVAITGGTIDGTVIGGITPANAFFTNVIPQQIFFGSTSFFGLALNVLTTTQRDAIAGGGILGNLIANSTTNTIQFYDGAAWQDLVFNAALGTMAFQNSTFVSITGGAIDNTVIGATTPNTAKFTTVQANSLFFSITTAAGLRLNNLTTTQQNALPNAQGALIANTTTTRPSYNNGTTWNQIAYSSDYGTIAPQNANAVAITGGTIDGTVIGGTTPANGIFLNLIANQMFFGNTGFFGLALNVLTTTQRNAIISGGIFGNLIANSTVLRPEFYDGTVWQDLAYVGDIPSFGTMATQNANAVAITGGAISGVTINNSVIGGTTRANGNFNNIVAQTIAFDLVTAAGLTLHNLTDTQLLALTNFGNGSLIMSATNNRVEAYQSSSSTWKQLAYISDLPFVGTLGVQAANAVAITGGTINNTTIGATTPTTGKFTILSANSMSFNSTTNAGLILNNLTTTQQNAIASPITGSLIANTTTTHPSYYDGTAWRQIGLATDLGTMAAQNANAVAITGGTMQGVTISNSPIDSSIIGGSFPAAATFTNVFAKNISFNSTGDPGIKLNNVTTVQQNLLTAAQGDLVANTTLTRPTYYDGTAWNTLAYLTDITAGGLGKPVIAVLPSSTSGSSTSGTSPTNLKSYILPANTLNTNGDYVIVRTRFIRNAGGTTPTLSFADTFASNALATFSRSPLTAAFTGEAEHIIVRMGTATATVYSKFLSSTGAGAQTGESTLLTGLDWTINQTLQFTAQTSDATTSITQELLFETIAKQ